MQLPVRRPRRGGLTRGLTLASAVALLSGLFSVPVLAALTAKPAAAAAANAVVPDSAITGFTPPPSLQATMTALTRAVVQGTRRPACTDNETGPRLSPLDSASILRDGVQRGLYQQQRKHHLRQSPAELHTFGLAGTSSVVIAPFFADIDTRVGNTVEFGTGTLNGHRVFVVNWPGVGCFDQNDSVTDNFQLILIDRPTVPPVALAMILTSSSTMTLSSGIRANRTAAVRFARTPPRPTPQFRGRWILQRNVHDSRHLPATRLTDERRLPGFQCQHRVDSRRPE